MIYPKIPLAQNIIQICLAKNISQIVISPGSRNAPLTIGFASNSAFTSYSIVDERCAAFFALGIAQQSHQPVVLVCTSGSALLNYYPAFAEAFYSQIPLIIISADRPLQKIDIGDGQTIRQQNVFSNHSLYNANLTAENSIENDLKIDTAIQTAIHLKGPVHINAPFEEPLYETTMDIATQAVFSVQEVPSNNEMETDFEIFSEIYLQSKRILVLVGVQNPFVISEEVTQLLANDPSVIVMTETTSNWHHPSFIASIDTIISPFSESELESFTPDLLITFGGMIVSKRVKAFLRKYSPKKHWHIDPLRAYDTFGVLTNHFKMPVNDFFQKIAFNSSPTNSDYFERMDAVVKHRNKKAAIYLNKIPFSDFKVFDAIAKKIPENQHLQISNSSAIRYAQLVAMHPSIAVFCNRGTSGIDGSTSTAIGAAVASKTPTTLLTGDIGFLYDSNALWNNYIPKNFKIILINNGGGGIFRILPGHEDNEVFSTFFETQHHLTAQYLAKMHGLDYLQATNLKELEEQLDVLYTKSNNASILEIFTPTTINDTVLKQFFKEII